jgi:hypothetical protein
MDINIQKAWEKAASKRPGVSAELNQLIPPVCEAIDAKPTDTAAIKKALDALLTFLASPAGRTDANCVAVDHFFCHPEYGWDSGWDRLPESLVEILSDMAGALHDTIKAPEIAANFESTPEQLLRRLRAVSVQNRYGETG